MEIKNIHPAYNYSFQGYKIFKGSAKEIDALKLAVEKHKDDFIFINRKKGRNKETIELLTGKHFDKLIDLMRTHSYFAEIRNNLPKYLGTKPEKISAAEYIKNLNKKR